MKRVLGISVLGLCALTLASCASTHDILEDVYKNKAKSECENSSRPSDPRQNPRCIDGDYFPN